MKKSEDVEYTKSTQPKHTRSYESYVRENDKLATMMPIPGRGNGPFHNRQFKIQRKQHSNPTPKSALGVKWMYRYNRNLFPTQIGNSLTSQEHRQKQQTNPKTKGKNRQNQTQMQQRFLQET